MQAPAHPVLRDIVLVGGGHSHVVVLKRFGMRPEPGVRLTLICRDTHTPYSGMLPGYIAGHYSYDDVHIDLSRLAQFADVRFYRDEAVALDLQNNKVLCKDHPPVAFDKLSINIGSTPQVDAVPGAAEHSIPVKPINRFNERWLALLARIEAHRGPLSIALVGGGAGGVELALAIQYRLQTEFQRLQKEAAQVHLHLFNSAEQILPTHNTRVQQRFTEVLKARGIQLHSGTEVTQVTASQVMTAAGAAHHADEILWVTQAGGADWLRDTGLALDAGGFIKINAFLQSISHEHVFAAGDIASMVGSPREKAGVFAVRQGKPLEKNLRRAAQGRSLEPYHPQRHWLALISTGDRYAVASRGGLEISGGWVWRWKDWIDRRFMNQFSKLPEMDAQQQTLNPALTLDAEEKQQSIAAVAMRCGGCGAKVGSTALSLALQNLQPFDSEDVLVGLHAPDDAAVVKIPVGRAGVYTVDFFRAFIDDPYVFGQIAANHALGDVFAMGAVAQSATAVATVPPGLEVKTSDLVFQMMSGAIKVLNEAECTLVGGHTGEGSELALGFAVNGHIDPAEVMRKAGMQAGQVIVLTKPIGTGTLLAAHARLAAKGRWIDAALASMMVSNRAAADCLRRYGATACTDLTGFGLLGHLVEMTRPSGVDVALDMGALPVLSGAEDTVAAGVMSSLQAANVRLKRSIRNQHEMLKHPRYPLLFDPQTAGGLLASLPADHAAACVTELQSIGYFQSAIIGRVLSKGEAPGSVLLLS